MTKLSPAGWSWLGLTIYVIAADSYLIIQESLGNKKYYTMSTAFRKSLHHPTKIWLRWFVIFLWISLTVHFFSAFLPEKYRKLEPIAAGGEIFKFTLGAFGVEIVPAEADL
jgi:hypothetical protein